MTLFVCGIDPGLKGGLAILEGGKPLTAIPLPIIDRAVDVAALSTFLDLYAPDKIYIELQGIRGGQAGAMRIGANYGRILAVVELTGYAHKIITAPVWNKAVGIPPGLKGKAKKEASYATARRMWGPSFSKLGLRVTQDGPVEALLIALAGQAKYKA